MNNKNDSDSSKNDIITSIEDINDIDNGIIKSEDLSSLGELANVDSILTEAAAATDEGDFQSALEGFEHALELTRKIFGDNLELAELKNKIDELHELLLLDEQSDDQHR